MSVETEAQEVVLLLAEVERRSRLRSVYVSHHDGLWWASASHTRPDRWSKLVWDASLHAALTSLLEQLPEVPE